MKMDAYGKLVEVVREKDEWVFYVLGEGKRRRVVDIMIPPDLQENEILTFVADILHELATPEKPEVKLLD